MIEVPSGVALRTLRAPPVPMGPNEPHICGDSGMDLNRMVFSGDRRLLAVETFSNMHSRTIDVWDVGGRKLLCRIDQQRFFARSWSFSPDGRTLAAIGMDDAVHLFDTATGKATAEFEGEGTGVSALAFSPDGKKLLTGTRASVRVWDAVTGRHERVLTRDVEWVRSLAFSPEGTRVLSAGNSPGGNQDDNTRVWSLAKGALVRNLVNPGYSHTTAAWSPDGKTVAVTGGRLRLFKADADAEPVQLAADMSGGSVAFSADGRLLVYESGSTLHAWDLAAEKLVREIKLPEGVLVFSAAVSPDGSLLAAGCSDVSVRLWRTDGKGDEPVFHLGGKSELDFIASLAFSPDGKLLALAGHDEPLHLWNVATGTAVTTVAGAFAPVAFSRDGTRLATSGGDSTALVWDVARLLARGKEKPPGRPK